MPIVFYLSLALAGGIAMAWIVRLAAVGAALRNRCVLDSQSYGAPPHDPPKISVIVAAKDEEANIGACVESLLDQDYPNFELIVVDDRSMDGTPAILRRLQRKAGDRLTIVTVNTLRQGWFGKNNAMREGVAVATGEWLLFTDADCRQTSRRTLSVAMGEALHHHADFLSITPVLETPTVWERIIQPVCALTLILWYLPEKVNDPEKRTAYANGAFMLMRRSCYEEIGGHERVRKEVNEDISMARFAKRMGLRLRVVENDDLYRTRMYTTPRAAWHGWSRIFFGSLQTVRRLFLSAWVLSLLCIVPWLGLVGALVGRAVADADSATPWTLSALAWAVVVVLEQITTWRVYTILRVAPVWSLTYIVGALIALGMLLNAMLKVLGATATTWRGTTYRGGRLDDRAAALHNDHPAPSPAVKEPAPHG